MSDASKLAAVSMSHVFVTMNARWCFAFRILREHLVDYLRVTIEAGILRHAGISWLDMNWLVKIFERERQGMKKTVVSLGDPMA